MPKITKRTVDALKPSPGEEIFLWDSELKGFGVRMMPTGIASYVLKYRNHEGRQRKLAIARVGAITPNEARGLALQHAAKVATGEDPSADRQQIRRSITVAELCDLYTAATASRIKASTQDANRSRIERHVKPLIGNRTVVSLTPADVNKLQSDIAAGKTAAERLGRGGVTTGGKGVASRTIGMLATILEFAKKQRVIEGNVARGVDRPPDGKQRRYLSLDEVTALGAVMKTAEANGESDVALGAIRFLLLSGCRRMEVLALPEAWCDAGNNCIRFADTKSGAQIRPIGTSAFAAIADVRRRNGWVFPASRGKGHFVGLPKVLRRLCKAAKLDGITIHVLRHTFAATAAGMGFSELTIAGLLGHTVQGVTARYAHVPDGALVLAANRVSATIAEALHAGKKVQIVTLRQPRVPNAAS
jgi:integrase